MTTKGWTPSPELARATTDALAALSRQYPRALELAFTNTEAGRAFITDYAFALTGVTIEAIQAAPRAWISDNKFAPRPQEFAECARRIARAMRRGEVVPEPASPAVLPAHLPMSRLVGAHDAVVRRLRTVTGCTWPEASAAYALLLETATTPARRQLLDENTMSDDVLKDAVEGARRRRLAALQAKEEMRMAAVNANAHATSPHTRESR